MNDARRKELDKAIDLLDEARTIIEDCKDDEQDALDNLPEGLQDDERAEILQKKLEMQGAIYSMEEADNYIDSLVEAIEDAMERR